MNNRVFLTRDEWTRVAKRRLGTDQLEVLGFELRPLGTEGAGFLGEHYFAEVRVQLKNSQRSERLLRFFVKAEPLALPEQKETSDQTGSFRKEVEALSGLFVEFRSALKNDGKDMPWTCECFYTKSDVIVLEDLAEKGFRIINSRIEAEFKQCAVVMRTLANFHAASLIFEETRPVQPFRLGRERAEVLDGGFIQRIPGHPGVRWMDASIKCVCSILKEMRGKEELLRIKSQIKEALYSLFDLVKTSGRYRNVVCHGDIWRNNIFFRLEDDEPVEALLVDFQLVRYAPPANDVMSFFHLTTSRAFRAQHVPSLLPLYHEHLTQNLTRHGLRVEKILPWEEFKESCEFYKKLGVTISPCESSIMFLKEENLSHVFASSAEFDRFLMVDRSEEALHAFKTDDIYRERMIDVIEELIEVFIEKK